MTVTIEVLNKWSSVADKAALDVLIAAAPPGVSLVSRTFAGDLAPAIARGKSAGAPFIAKMHGQDLAAFPDADDLAGLLAPDFMASLPAPVRALMIRPGGRMTGLPVGLHRANTLFFNAALLARHAVAPPDSAEALAACVERLAAAGVRPFALCPDPMLLGFVFESIVLSVGGPALHGSLYAAADRNDDPDDAALDAAHALWTRIVATSLSDETGWREAGRHVRDGAAAFLACGDFAAGFMKEGDDPAVGQAAFPGTADAFIFIADFFTPMGFAAAGADALLAQLVARWTEPGTLSRFAAAKGAVPLAGGPGAADHTLRAGLVPSLTLEQAAPERVRRAVLDVLLADSREPMELARFRAGLLRARQAL